MNVQDANAGWNSGGNERLHPRVQRGQALPVGLALILAGALGGFVLYNSGQSAIDKTRLVNAADAAAYSGAQWQARALNFQAYTNRAMVANQVTLAQAVTLESWTTYGRIMSENIARVLSAVPFVNGIAAGVQSVMSGINRVVSPIAGAMLSVVDGINAGIGFSQKAMFASTFVATPAVVKAVVEGSDPRFQADTAYGVLGALGNLREWQRFTARVGNEQQDYVHMRERAELIRQSRDDFSRNRDWDFFGGYLYIAPGVKIEIAKEGRTELFEREGDDGLEWEWKAKDTLSFHTRINLLFKRDHIEVPIGYGGAFANNADSGDRSIEQGACEGFAGWFGNCARMLDENELSESLVDANAYSLAGTQSRVVMSGYSGLREFRRLSDTTRERAFPTLRLRVEAAMPLSGTASTARVTGAEPFDVPLVARGDMASSISIAEAYFKPPDADLWIAGDTLEFANAYSPFWSVRLAPVPAADKLAAFALRESGNSVPEDDGARAPDAGPGATGRGGSGGVSALFAGSLDADEGELGTLMAAAAGRGARSIAEAVARDYADELLGDAVEQIKRQLEDELEDAVADILAGIARGAAASVVGERNLRTAEQLVDVVQELDEQIDSDALNRASDDALADVEAMQAEFRRVDEVLVQEFAPFFDEQVTQWRRVWAGRVRRLANAADRPFGLFDIPAPARLSNALHRDLAREARLARRELIERLSQEYLRIVTGASDSIDLDARSARQLVIMLMRAYEDADGGEIDFTLFDDADMALPEPEPEPGPGAEPGDEAPNGAGEQWENVDEQ